MDHFPKMLFCFPALALVGAVAEPLQDGVYGVRTVASDEEHDAALAEGWHESPADARAAHAELVAANLKADAGAGDDETRPPSRDELKAKAKELGLTFAHNITTDKLAELVAEKLKA
jgi:hypothetical protein